ncbi:MAG: hypothetical protein J0I07_17510 [Myxococcales bacterium]|nr:hypothetical protein [Myxococcales bacterium]
MAPIGVKRTAMPRTKVRAEDGDRDRHHRVDARREAGDDAEAERHQDGDERALCLEDMLEASRVRSASAAIDAVARPGERRDEEDEHEHDGLRQATIHGSSSD